MDFIYRFIDSSSFEKLSTRFSRSFQNQWILVASYAMLILPHSTRHQQNKFFPFKKWNLERIKFFRVNSKSNESFNLGIVYNNNSRYRYHAYRRYSLRDAWSFPQAHRWLFRSISTVRWNDPRTNGRTNKQPVHISSLSCYTSARQNTPRTHALAHPRFHGIHAYT